MKTISLIAFIILNVTAGYCQNNPNGFPVLNGPYLGQSLPGSTPEIFARGIVSTDFFNHSTVCISSDGTKTLDENIAELDGLSIAYDAYKKSLTGKPEPSKIDGFTDDQRFFIAYAMKDGVNIRDESLINWVKTNSHSPDRIKINGALFNLDEFYDAFPMITKKNKLYINKEDRAIIF